LQTDDDSIDLSLELHEHDRAIEAAALATLANLGIGAFALDAEAFRLGLADQIALSQLIASEEARCAQLIDAYVRRRANRPAPPVIDAEFAPA
jgi:hypothetical protein